MTDSRWSLVTYELPGGDRKIGILDEDGVVHVVPASIAAQSLLDLITGWDAALPELQTLDVSELQIVSDANILAPLLYPSKILCAGANYYAHVVEMGGGRPEGPVDPYFFFKPPTTTVVGPGAAIVLPARPTRQIDWEAELAVVIGRRCHDVSPGAALEHIAGYTIVNDVSARDRLGRVGALAPPFAFDWVQAKAEDTFCPIGPGITPAWFVDDPQNLDIRLTVNGAVKQDSNTSDMIVGVAELVSAASRILTLEPGDVIVTGCPAGVGAARGEFLQPGDEVVVEIEGLGALRNPVVAPTEEGSLS